MEKQPLSWRKGKGGIIQAALIEETVAAVQEGTRLSGETDRSLRHVAQSFKSMINDETK